MDITYSFKDTKKEQQFKQNALPSKYEYNLKKSQDNFDKGVNEILQKLKAEP